MHVFLLKGLFFLIELNRFRNSYMKKSKTKSMHLKVCKKKLKVC